ncbi:MAG: hypothetical protein GY931_00380 [Maribacter sp.]|nr:hypothetical protein [Maribacter sp.]
MSNVLIYVRPWNAKQMANLGQLVFKKSRVIPFSEHRGYDLTDYHSAFYALIERYRREGLFDADCLFDQSELADIVLRCRLLRSLDFEFSRLLVFAAASAINQCLQKYSPEFILSVTVDSYVIDILARLARRKNIEFIGLVPTFVDGYFRITERGEKKVNRTVSGEEVNKALSMLKAKEYKPQWLAANNSAIKKKAYRLWSRNLIKPAWFYVYSKFRKDPLNYHYIATSIVARQCFSFFPKLYSANDCAKKINAALSRSPLVSVFLPLQMSPEATIDYWSSDTSWIDYEAKILKTVDEYKDKHVFVVKEHPNVFGFRSRSFYKQLQRKDNIILVNPEVPSNELIEVCDAVLVSTGTVGFESLLRGKPVISSSAPYYAVEDRFLNFDSCLEKKSSKEDYKLVEYLLSGFLPGTFVNDGTWSQEKHKSGNYNELVATSICDCLSA